MPFIIPESMPQDWLVPALDGLGISVSDDRSEAIEAAMKKTYNDILVSARISTLNARLRVGCLASAHLSKDG